MRALGPADAPAPRRRHLVRSQGPPRFSAILASLLHAMQQNIHILLKGLPQDAVLLPLQPCDWTIKMNKKERRLGVATALQSAADSITVIDDVKVRTCTSPGTHCSRLMPCEVPAALSLIFPGRTVLQLHAATASTPLQKQDSDKIALPVCRGL